MLVSVVIPAHNCSAYIADTIDSILKQQGTTCQIEVIVINDGSTDNTGAIAREFGGVVRVIDQTNAGVCAARNHGIREAKGDFIALVDHDDYWLPHKLAKQLAIFESNPDVGVVYSEFQRWAQDATGKFAPASSFDDCLIPEGIDGEFSGWIYHQMLLDSWVLTSTALARRSFVVGSGGFDESLPFSEDWDFWLRISRETKFMKLRDKTTLYRQHPTQGSRVIRPIDYRTRLLENAAKKWGLCSRDGRCITPTKFKRQLAMYCTSFGKGHLSGSEGASRLIAVKALTKSFLIDPSYWRALAYLAAMIVGWKPSYK